MTRAEDSRDLTSLADADLLKLRLRLDSEMRRRGIAYSVGEIGERAAVEYFRSTSGLPNLQHAPTGTKNVDALSRDGNRYSIKTVWKGKKTGTIYPDPDDADKQLFEYLLIVRLGDDWAVRSIHQLSWKQFLSVRAWDKRMNAWYVGVSARTLAQGTTILS
jgi:hypothetical protein